MLKVYYIKCFYYKGNVNSRVFIIYYIRYLYKDFIKLFIIYLIIINKEE